MTQNQFPYLNYKETTLSLSLVIWLKQAIRVDQTSTPPHRKQEIPPFNSPQNPNKGFVK